MRSYEPEIREFVAALAAMQHYVAGVRLDDAAVRRLVEHGKSFHDAGLDDLLMEDGNEDGTFSYADVLAAPRYVSWTRERGLDPHAWLGDIVRWASISTRPLMERMRGWIRMQYATARGRLARQRGQGEITDGEFQREIQKAERNYENVVGAIDDIMLDTPQATKAEIAALLAQEASILKFDDMAEDFFDWARLHKD